MRASLAVLATTALLACGANGSKPVSLSAPACAVTPGTRAAIEHALEAGELERAARMLANAAVSCPTDAWIQKTTSETARAFATTKTGDELLAQVARESGADATRDRDRALRAFERETNAHAVAVGAPPDPAENRAVYSPKSGFVRLGSHVVDVHAGKLVARVGDAETLFAPDDSKLAVSAKDTLTVLSLPAGDELFRTPEAHPLVSWSDDARWLAWIEEGAGWVEVATKRVHPLGDASVRFDFVAMSRGVIAARSEDGALVVKHLAEGDVVAKITHVESFAIDHDRDRLVYLETPMGPLRELDLATAKTKPLAFKSPRYEGMCGAGAGWRIASLTGNDLGLTRDCSGVDDATVDLKTQRGTFSTTPDGADMPAPDEEWGHDDKTAWEDVRDVDFGTYDRVVRSPKRDTFAGYDGAGRARVWTKAGKVVWASAARPEKVEGVVSSGAEHADGSQILTFSHASELRRWDAKTGALLATRTLPKDCGFRALVARDDGEGVVSCTTSEIARAWRERIAAPVVDRKRRDTAELAVLDRRGAFMVFEPSIGKPLEILPLEPGAAASSRALPAPWSSLLDAAGDVVLLRNPHTAELALYRWSSATELLVVPTTGGPDPYRYRDWAALAGRGAWLAAERINRVELWSISGDTVTKSLTLAPSPASPNGIAIAGAKGPVVVRGSIRFATWSDGADKPVETPSAGGKSIDYSAARAAFIVPRESGVSIDAVTGGASLRMYAVPFTNAAAAICDSGGGDANANVVRFTGDRKLAEDLVTCEIGSRQFPYRVCAGRFDAL